MGSVRNIVELLAIVLTVLVLGRVVSSWVDPARRSDASRFLVRATEPILGPIRRAMPQTGTARPLADDRPDRAVAAHPGAPGRRLPRWPDVSGGSPVRGPAHAACRRRSHRRRPRRRAAGPRGRPARRWRGQRCAAAADRLRPRRAAEQRSPAGGGHSAPQAGRNRWRDRRSDRGSLAGPARIIGRLRFTAGPRGRLAQSVRARGSHPRGHWFESSIAHHLDDTTRPRARGPILASRPRLLLPR